MFLDNAQVCSTSRTGIRMLFACISATLILFLGACTMQAAEAPAQEISTNSSFAQGIVGWQASGDVHIGMSTTHPQRPILYVGPAGTVSQKIRIGAENHCMFSALFDGGLPESSQLALSFLDKAGSELMHLESGEDMQADKNGKIELYFRPHPRTESIEIVLTNHGASRPVEVAQMKLSVYDDGSRKPFGTQQVSEWMRPFWQGNIISQEAVALFSMHGGPATGTLLLRPTKILSVTTLDGSIAYKPDVDYKAAGRTLTAVDGSPITRIEDEKLLHEEIAWNEIGGRQVLVTYEHEDPWTGPIQPYVGAGLPNTMHKLAARKPIEVVAYGDSITFGVGSGQMQKLRPYQMPWIDLFVHSFAAVYGQKAFTLDNAAQSGADSNWARRMAGRMVASLHPDLVILAFGQNDFWSVTPEKFSANIAAVIQTVREANPNAEFLLVSTIRFDPAYSSKPEYWNAVTDYDVQLHALAGPGVQVVDMTAISGAVFAAKAPKDCLNDPLHPNDYFSRWYAQSMMAALVPEFGRKMELPPASTRAPKKGIGDNDQSAPEAVSLSGAHWYYNWTAHATAAVKDVEFVPMVWGSSNIDGDVAAARQSGAKMLLTFNEPDDTGEANLTVEQAIALWPKLEASGLRLGSPATTTGAAWIDRFMEQAKERKYRVDFLCLHWYGDITKPDAINDLRLYLESYWNRYHLPIWLTEFSGGEFPQNLRKTTVDDNVKFATDAVKMLESLPFVERYAWYGTRWEPDQENYPTSGLYNDRTHWLTPVGRAYRTAGAGG